MPGPLDVLPVAHGVGLPWDVPVDDAVAVIATARAACGDSFVLRSGGDYLFTFSPSGSSRSMRYPRMWPARDSRTT